jgi:MTH538 TIR-like domain (DUF1863)
VSDNDWESITSGGDQAIKDWIVAQQAGKSCAVVLIRANTAGRKWINFEIETARNAGIGVGVYVHNLLDSAGLQSGQRGVIHLRRSRCARGCGNCPGS